MNLIQFVDIKTGKMEPNQTLDISGKSTEILPEGCLGLDRYIAANEKYFVFPGQFGMLAVDLQVKKNAFRM